MAEYVGSKTHQSIQQDLRMRIDEIRQNPAICHGGNILEILEPESYGWGNVAAEADRYGMIAFPANDPQAIYTGIDQHLKKGSTTGLWTVFEGSDTRVEASSLEILASWKKPVGWWVKSTSTPDIDEIAQFQKLNEETGVLSYPAYFLRGEVAPAAITLIWDDMGALVATAGGSTCYHPESRMGGNLLGGKVSVAENYRGQGLGKIVNAQMLVDSLRLLGWTYAVEFASLENAPSRAMLKACGLMDKGRSSIAAIALKEGFTR